MKDNKNSTLEVVIGSFSEALKSLKGDIQELSSRISQLEKGQNDFKEQLTGVQDELSELSEEVKFEPSLLKELSSMSSSVQHTSAEVSKADSGLKKKGKRGRKKKSR